MDKFAIKGAAVQWLDTPYHHQAKIKNVGVDCAMLIVAIAEELSGKTINIPVYSPEWHLHNKEELLCTTIENLGCVRKDISDMDIGDILTFKFGRVNSHMGVYIGTSQFIHARLDVKKVVINQLSGEWSERLDRVYKFPETL